LNLLADEIVARNFNARDFLRELALTKVYQQAIDLPEAAPELTRDFAAKLDELKARIAALESTAERTRKVYASAVKAWHHIEESLVPLVAEQDKMVLKHAEAVTKKEAAQKAVSDAESHAAAGRDRARVLSEAAARAQDAVKKIPKDKELADAAATFAKRHAATAAELTSLEKATAEKKAALMQANEAIVAAAKSIEAARAKVQPARQSVRQQEQIVLTARHKMAETRSVVEAQQKRLKLLESLARYSALKKQAAESERALIARRDALGAAKKRVAEIDTLFEQRQSAARAADLARVSAEKTHSGAQAALTAHQKIVAAVDAAQNATEAARQLLPDDPALTQAAQMIKEKSADLQKTVSALKAKVDEAAGPLAKTAETHEKAKTALVACLEEKAKCGSHVAVALAEVAAQESRTKVARSNLVDAASEFSLLRGNHFAQAHLKPLTPEQICWSILKVTGVYDRYWKVEEAELDKKKPLIGPSAYDPVQKITRALELERRTFEKLKGNVAPFIAMYAAAPGQPQNDFFATADQALFTANGGSINSWIAPSGGNVSERMIQEKDPKNAATDLYMTVLSRPPVPEEAADVARILSEREKDKSSAVQELVWGLLSSVEFRFNH
jgi:chromosome segregation ATPase